MHGIVNFNGVNSFKMCCDFCAASEYQEGVRLIASPNGAHICQNCVAVCVRAVEDQGWEPHEANKPSTITEETA